MEPVLTLTTQQMSEFDRAGMLHVPGYFEPALMLDAEEAIWRDLARRYGIRRDDPASWKDQHPAQFQGLVRSGAFAPLSPAFAAVADTFIGKGEWSDPSGLPLVTLPTGQWDVPHSVWHLDWPGADYPERGLPTVRAFAILAPLEAKGGGTPFVEGSHHIAMAYARRSKERLRSADIKALLQREEPWFAELFTRGSKDRERRLMHEGGVAAGVPVKVREISGNRGDLWIMHPALLHTIAPNVRERPRMMIVQVFVKRGWTAQFE